MSGWIEFNGERYHHSSMLQMANRTSERRGRERDALRAAIDRSGFDLSPCGVCGEPVVCIPDGLPMCEPCARKESNEQ